MVALSNLSSAITSSSSPDSVRLRVAADCDSIATAIAVATASGVLLNDYFTFRKAGQWTVRLQTDFLM